MIEIHLCGDDLSRATFAYSPLAEVGRSLQMLLSARIPPAHRQWSEEVRRRLRSVNVPLLAAFVPPSQFIADFLFAGAVDRSTTIESQLGLFMDLSSARLEDQICEVWSDRPVPADAARVIADGQSGRARLAEALLSYWSIAIAPYWQEMRAVLDDDVNYRGSVVTRNGMGVMLADLHDEVSIGDDTLRIAKRAHPGLREQVRLTGQGLTLVPSIFTWPSIIFSADLSRKPSLTYGARGVGRLWGSPCTFEEDNAIADLIGRNRARILSRLSRPRCTTELARELQQSPGAVSNHLSVLRRVGLVTSWRSGRRVLYLCSPLGTSLLGYFEQSHVDASR